MKKDDFIWDTIDIDDGEIDDFDETSILDEEINLIEIDDEKIISIKKKFKKSKLKSWRMNIRVITATSLMLVTILFFTPLFTISEIKINETNFNNTQTFLESSKIQVSKKISFFDVFKLNGQLKRESGLKLRSAFDFRSGLININVIEQIPILRDGIITHYVEDGVIKEDKEFKFSAPVLIDLPEDKKEKLITNLSKIDYNVIKEIANISYVPDDLQQNLILLQMKDGNYVYIRIDQIEEKLNYYNKMVSIVKKINGKDNIGIFHLDNGDYYEKL